MSMQTKLLLLISLAGVMLVGSFAAEPSKGVTIYTPYTKISVPPGESLDYTVDLINNTDVVQNLDISISGIPRGWDFDLKSGGWKISRISVLPGEKKSLNLKVEVPLKINKGTYGFTVNAGQYTLPLSVIVSEQGTYKTEFTTTQANMEGQSNATFTYNAKLRNRTAEKQLYGLTTNAPRGWNVSFRAGGKQVTSVEVEPNNIIDITIEVKPPAKIEAGTYKFPIRTATSNTSAELELEAVITGSYEMELTTPQGLLSTSITAGDEKKVELVIHNPGSSELRDIEFSANKPVDWSITFEPSKVDVLRTGGSTQVTAIIKAPQKVIPGDYATKITARTPEASSGIDFRITVKTSMLSGWLGILIILIVIGGIYYLFRKYGRR
ncbi:MAG: hypothetical protein LBQ60_03625 [Bacteroidales bacterium]|nr:hypothetical protein [Bacteroidales bacterium]